jgi:hypothetical protein
MTDTPSLNMLAQAWYAAFGEGDRSMTYDALTMERVQKLRDALQAIHCAVCGVNHATLDHGPDDGPIDDREEDDSDRSGVESDSEHYARAAYLANSTPAIEQAKGAER